MRIRHCLHQLAIITRSSATVEIARDADNIDFSETTIQGHSRSPVVAPIDETYMTSYCTQ